MEENNNVVQNDTIVNEPNNIVAEPVAQNNLNNNKGSKKGFIIIITLLVLIIAGLLVYMFVIKGDDKDQKSTDNTNNTNNINNTENTNNNSDENNNTNNNDNSNNNQTNDNSNIAITDEDVEKIVEIMHKYYLFNLTYDDSSNTFSKAFVTNGQLLGLETYESVNNNLYNVDENERTISKENADSYFMKAYGFKPDNYKDIICLVDKEPLYKYENNMFKWNGVNNVHGHGGWSGDFEDYYVVNKSSNGNEISLDFVFLYYGEFSHETYINGTYAEMSDDIDYDKYSGEERSTEQRKYFKEHINEYTSGKLYNFVFTKDGDNYYLKSYKIK